MQMIFKNNIGIKLEIITLLKIPEAFKKYLNALFSCIII